MSQPVRRGIGQHLVTASIGVLSLVVTTFGQEFWAGVVFFSMGPAHGAWGYRSGALISAADKRRQAQRELAQPPPLRTGHDPAVHEG